MLIYLNRLQSYYKSSESPNILKYFSAGKSFSSAATQKTERKISIYRIKLRYLQTILRNNNLIPT